jgi:DNA-binding FadR family transcriptional regulator
MPLVRADQAKLSDAVLRQLQTLIEDGEWPPGSRIPPEPELVAALGVGRNTVREAVRALEHAGLLEPRRGDGTYVRASSEVCAALVRRAERVDVLEVFEVRAMLERDAARLAAERRNPEDLRAIDDALHDMRLALRGTTESFVAADVRFHAAVVAAAGNRVLTELYDGLTQAIHHGISTVLTERPSHRHGLVRRHEDLAAAVTRRDGNAAQQAIAAIIQGTATAIERAGAVDGRDN